MADEFPLALAHRPDFALGAATVRPSVRTVEGPGGATTAEPRVMQVLLALADARGAVLTRADLLRLCWNGQIVGDDAIHRAISEARRVARTTQAGFAIETVPRIGYRLTVEEVVAPETVALAEAPSSRRALLIGGGALTLAFAGGGGWLWHRHRTGQRLTEIIERGIMALQHGTAQEGERSIALFEQATALDPQSAAAWGWLATARRRAIGEAWPGHGAETAAAGERAARHALSLDPREANARATLVLTRAPIEGWIATEDGLKAVLRDAPDCVAALDYLVTFQQAVGRCAESRALNDRLLRITPYSASTQHRAALKHWIFGDLDKADRVIDAARQLWPTHPLVWNSRLLIYAFSGRAPAALAMIGDKATHPAGLQPLTLDVWRGLLEALDSRAPGDVATARDRAVAAATSAPYVTANVIMALSALDEVDAAFDLTNGFLLGRGHRIGQPVGTGQDEMLHGDPGWRKTQWLFTPATASLRADPRFVTLARDIGYADYWRARGIGPDAFMRGALA